MRFSAQTAFYIASMLVLQAMFVPTFSYPFFKGRIPNGNNVRNPCFPLFTVGGVGHIFTIGGGPLNEFGKDFNKAGNKWTVELCQKDSDGDGLTNGEELGDPDCEWSVGTYPKRTTNITHPGIDNNNTGC